jgi:hypothetical protein
MEGLLPILQPLQVVTSLLSTETSLSSSTVYPLVYEVNRRPGCKTIRLADHKNLKKGPVCRALADRFQLSDPATPKHPFVVASVLDSATNNLAMFDTLFKETA